MRFPEISWRGNLILADDLESSIHVDGFDYHLNFKILQHHSVRKLMHIFHWSIQIKFCEINLSEKSFQAILQCSEKKKNLVTIFTNHNAVWNSKSRVAVQFNLLSYNSLLYPYIIFFVRRSNVSTCNLHITSGHQFNGWQKSAQQIALDSSLGLEAFYVMSTSDKFANTWLFVWFTTMAFPKRTWLLWKQL